jgi:hypothetical protein
MATHWGIALAVATAAPTPQWAMALAMATMAVGLTEDTGHMLSTDLLKYLGDRIFSPQELSSTSPVSSFVYFFRPHLLSNLQVAAFENENQSPKGRN